MRRLDDGGGMAGRWTSSAGADGGARRGRAQARGRCRGGGAVAGRDGGAGAGRGGGAVGRVRGGVG
jgi:hypothetical protein